METLEIETVVNRKKAIKAFKNLMKIKAQQQHDLKKQRKTKYFVGTRTVDPNTATWQVQVNKVELKAMYDANELLKKTIDTLSLKGQGPMQKYIDLFNMNL